MSNTTIFKGKLPQNLHPDNREVAVIISDEIVTLLVHTIAAPSGSGIVADDIVFLVPLAPNKKESECICIKIGDKMYIINRSDPKKPKIKEVK